ncbi:hypothetical protein [Nonomuraea dietziae]|uniref:hypothetical protein n=1 Tax=Nonomuraea dietziae TaxID=65515 RepID=UPI0031D8A508
MSSATGVAATASTATVPAMAASPSEVLADDDDQVIRAGQRRPSDQACAGAGEAVGELLARHGVHQLGEGGGDVSTARRRAVRGRRARSAWVFSRQGRRRRAALIGRPA